MSLLLFALLLATPSPAADPVATPPPAASPPQDEGPKGFLGIRIRGTSEGARILTVFANSGADAAGLQEGDLIVTADKESLLGFQTQDVTKRLKGAPDTKVKLEVVRFPGTGGPEKVVVTRRAQPPGSAVKGPKVMSEPQRSGNQILSMVQQQKPPNLDHVLKAWADAEDQADAERALVRSLRRLRNLPADQVQVFVDAAAPHAGFADHLASRSGPSRIAAARVLAGWPETAPLAERLVQGLDDTEAIVAMARAVAAGDAQAAAAARLGEPDVFLGGRTATFGPLVSDGAALRLVGDSAPDGLPEGVADRLVRARFPVSWEVPLTPPPFARTQARKAPDFTLPTRDGADRTLSAHTGPVALSFWASWCGPCRKELPALQALHEELKAGGFEVWAMNTDKERPKAEAMIEQLGLTLPVVWADSTTQGRYDVSSLPRLFVLDADKRILLDHTGFSEGNFPKVKAEITEVATGKRDGGAVLAHVAFGQPHVLAAGVAPVSVRPKALATDRGGRVWVLGQKLVRLSLQDKEVVATDDNIPLPMPADQAVWVDVDGDGTDEVVTSHAKAIAVRAGRPDGTTVWTHRHADPVGGLAVMRGPKGPWTVVLRQREENFPHPMGPLPNGNERPPAVRVVSSLHLLGPDGRARTVVPLPETGMQLAGHPDLDRAYVLLADGSVHAVTADGALTRVDSGVEGVRSVQIVGTSEGPIAAWTANQAKGVFGGKLGPNGSFALVAQTGGGDLVGLTAAGDAKFRLDLQRPALGVVGDLDGDGRDELVVWAHWFGFAALHTTY